MYFVWLRLTTAAIEIVSAVLLVPSTIILGHYGGRFRYLFIATLWITLTGFTWFTGVRIGKQLPITSDTWVTAFGATTVLVTSAAILWWFLYHAHVGRLPARHNP